MKMFLENREKVALVAGELQLSYNDLIRNVESYYSVLTSGAAERVVIFSENRVEWIVAFYALWQRGSIPVPIDFLSAAEDVAYIISDCTPSAVFCSEARLPVLKEALKTVAGKPKILVFEKLNTRNLSGKIPQYVIPNSNDTAVIIYTSGTTGNPKGVMLTFDNLMANIEGVTADVRIYSSTDRVMILLPLHHIFPLMGSMILPLYIGGTVAISPSMASEDIIQTLEKNRITLVIGVPRFYDIIRKGIIEKIRKSAVARVLFSFASAVKSKALSRFLFKKVHVKFGGHVRYLICGGAALDKQTARDLLTLGFEVLEGFGMTEAAPMITFTRPGNYIPGSAGQALPATRMEIRDDEIVASGRNIMKGYYNREQETNDIIKDGWLYTGDLGRIDKNGFLFITGRKKEIIVLSSGKNVNPEPLEKKLVSICPYINEVGVFMQHDVLQALIVADIQKMKNDGITAYEEYFRWNVIDRLNKEVTPYKRIMKFFLTTEELPKTRLGKVQRYKLSDIAATFSRERKPDMKEPSFKEYLAIKEFLESETGVKVFPNDHLEMDIALDSLGKITLLVFLESTFGIKIPEEEFLNYHTVLKLSEFICEKKIRSNFEIVNWAAILKEKVNINLPRTQFTLNVFNTISKIILNTYFRVRGEGTSNIPDSPCIIAPNHQSFFDGFFVASFLKWNILTKTYVYAKEKYWRTRWLRFLAGKNNIILMDINNDLKLSLQKMAAVLKKGKNIIIFPEGTRSSDGRLGQFKKTFAILSQELNVPVVPVAISGSYDALPAGAWFPRPFKKIRVKFLQPVYPVNHTYDSFKDLVRKKVASQLGKAY